MDLGQILSLMFWASVGLTALGYGLVARTQDVGYVIRNPRLLAVSLLAMFVVMPVIALALELYFDFPHATRVALVVLALTPISAGLARTEITAGGHASYAYGLAVVVAVAGTALVPALVHFLGRVMERPLDAPQGMLAFQLLGLVVAPLAVGLLIQRVAPRLANRLRVPMVKTSNIFLWLALVITLVLIFPSVVDVATLRTVLAMVVFVAAGLAVGHVMGGPDPAHSIVLAIACASRNPGMAIGIAAANFPGEDFVATMVLYGILVGLVTKPYTRWQTARHPAAEAAPAAPRPADTPPAPEERASADPGDAATEPTGDRP